MSFSTAPFTTVLGWCEKNKCNRIEITNLDNGFVQTLFVWKEHEVVIQINTSTLISSIEIKKDLGEDLKNLIFSQENILLENCLEILEFNLSNE
jgi:hypothetical protein